MRRTLATLPILSVLLAAPSFAQETAAPAPPITDAGTASVDTGTPPPAVPAPVSLPAAVLAPQPASPPPPVATKEPPPAPARPSSRRLEPIVVTESKVAQPQENVTQSVRTIYEDEIAERPENQRNLSEVLRYEPGIFVLPLSRNDANWGSYGGLGPKYNLYLLDGLPIDSFVDAMSLDPWAFERVESQRGPASVMYSNYLSSDFAGQESSLAGVTNFILRDKVDVPATKLRLGLGSYNTVDGKVYQQGSEGNLHYFFGGDYERSDYTDYGTYGSWLAMERDPAYSKGKVYGKATYFFGRDDHKLSLFLHHTTHTGDVGRYSRDFDNNYDTINLAYSNQLSDALHAQLKVGLRSYDRRWGSDSYTTTAQPPANELALTEHDGVQQKILPADLTFNLKHLESSFLTFGADSQIATYRTYTETPAGWRTTQNDATAMSAGIFLQERVTIGPLTVRGGGRFAHLSDSFNTIAGGAPGIGNQSWNKGLWSAGMRVRVLPEIAVFANAGTSFVPPAAKSVAGTLPPGDQGVVGENGQLPNKSLNPESGLGTDFGIDVRPIAPLHINLRGFFNQVSDQIVDNTVSQTPSQTQSVNAGKSRSVGGEAAVDLVLGEWLSGFANGTYTYTKIFNSIDPDQDGSKIPFVPNWMGNAGLTVRLPYRVAISPFVNAVGTFYDSSSKSGRQSFGKFAVPSLRAAKSWVRASHTVELSVALNNLANRQYHMPWAFRDPGFNGMAFLQFSM
jgi:iron complex outermembrane recepter protein